MAPTPYISYKDCEFWIDESLIGGATAKWSKILFLWIPLKVAGVVDIGLIRREKKFRKK